MPRKTHGENPKGNPSKEYRSWIAIKHRCFYQKHPKFAHYSKLGMFEAWKDSFPAFLEHIGSAPSESHSVDRINSALGYFPGNVRWATATTQARNRIDSVFIEVDGVPTHVSEVCQQYGIKRSTINERLRRGVTGAALIAPTGTFSRWNPAQ